jgi:HK97 family phage major capsid protein
MANALQDKIDARASVWEQMKACDLSNSEDAAKYDRLETEYDKLDADIDRDERHQARASRNSEVDRRGVGDPLDGDPKAEGNEAYASAFTSYMRRGMGALSHEDQQVLNTGWIDNPNAAAGVGTGAAGGYTVPPAFRQKIVERMNFVAAMRQLAEVINTDTGATLPWPTVDDTTNEGAILGENTQVTEQDVVFGQANLDAYMYTSKMVRVSLQLLQDNAFGLESWLANALGARIGRVQNRHFTVGTGINQPDGIVTSAPVGVTAAAVDKVTYDELVDLTEFLDPAYLAGGNIGWMLSQSARKGLRKLKDGQQRPLWEPSLVAGSPSTLMGYGVTLNNYMAAPATGVKSILFGDIREAYVIRDVSDFALLRLTERFADFLQVGFIGFQRSDGTLQNANAVAALKQA